MILNKSYGYWSVLLSMVGSFFLVTSYLISPDNPKNMMVVLIKIMLIVAVILMILGVVMSILAIRKKEYGFKKYVGILLPLFIVLILILIPILMGVGFIINDNA